MKIRHGFISNSSSTSFTFCIKDKSFNTLYSLIKKYKDKFDLDVDYGDDCKYSCNADMVIKEIKKVVRRKGKYSKVEIITIDDEIKRIDDNISTIKRCIKKDKEKNYDYSYWKKYIKRYDAIKKCRLNKAKELGLNYAIRLGFGDNHGDIRDGNVGYTMDYAGRNIKLVKDDFIIYTEQNR